jgi:hypothetical protein
MISPPDVEQVVERANFSEWDVDTATSGLCGTFALAMKSAFPSLRLALVCLADENGMAKIARDGQPYWRHVVVRDGERLFDIQGEALISDLVENYCWNNPHGKGGILVPIGEDDLLALVQCDGKSFDAGYLASWTEQLQGAVSASGQTPQAGRTAGPTASP